MTLVEILKSLNLIHPVQLQGQTLIFDIVGEPNSAQCIAVTAGHTSSSRTTLHLQPFFVSGDEKQGIRIERLFWDPASKAWYFQGICYVNDGTVSSIREETKCVQLVTEFLRINQKFGTWKLEE